MTLPAPEEKRRFVERMFDAIAPRYALMNSLMTFGIDRAWRREAVASLRIAAGARVVDLGCGTGDLLAATAAAGAVPIGVDLSSGMLREARRLLPASALARADAERLPLRGGSCDGVISGFAVRNFHSLSNVLAEAARVLRPGGRLALLEIDVPASSLARAGFDFYFRRIVPVLGGILSRGDAYAYLSESLVYLPAEAEMKRLLSAAGFTDVAKRRLRPGAAQLVTATRG